MTTLRAVGYKTIVLRLDEQAADDLAELAAHLGINKTALTQAGVELWSIRWREKNRDLEGFAEFYRYPFGSDSLWDTWVSRARDIEGQRRSRRRETGGRRSIMFRVAPAELAVARAMADQIGRRMLTALLQAVMEYWVAYWEEVGEPVLEWQSDDPPPPWFPTWQQWVAFTREVAAEPHGERQAAMVRFDAEVADGVERLAAVVGVPLTTLFEGFFRLWANSWADGPPALVWDQPGPPPLWWAGWLGMVDRAREIASARRSQSSQ